MKDNKHPIRKSPPGAMLWRERIFLAVDILLYLALLIFFISKAVTSFPPDSYCYWTVVGLWVIVGWIIPWVAWAASLRYLLPAFQEPATVLAKGYGKIDYALNNIQSSSFHYPTLTFDLEQSHKQVVCWVKRTHHNTLNPGDHGTLYYRARKDNFVFVDFIREDD